MLFRLAKGVSYRVGGHRGTYRPGPETQQVVDQGTIVITNQRVVFQGAAKTREWGFSKLKGVDHAEGTGATMIHVSNRQKVSGVFYGTDPEHWGHFRFRLDLALAQFSDQRDDLIVALKNGLSEVEAADPAPPAQEPN